MDTYSLIFVRMYGYQLVGYYIIVYIQGIHMHARDETLWVGMKEASKGTFYNT